MNLNSKSLIKFSEILDIIARILLMAMMIIIVVNVVARIIGRPLNGTSEWVGFLMSSAIALALSNSAVQGGQVSVSFIVEKLSIKKQMVAEIVVNLMLLIFLIFVTKMMINYGGRLLAGGTVGMTTKIPLFYFAYVISAGFIGYCLVLFGKIVDAIKKGEPK